VTAHIAFAINSGYAPWAAVSIRSLLDHHDPAALAFHFLNDGGLAAREERLLVDMANDAGAAIAVHRIDPDRVSALPAIDRFGTVVWLRFLLPEVLPDLERVLYLDADTFAATAVDDLWNAPLGDAPIAAGPNVVDPGLHPHVRELGLEPSHFLNSGVLLMNLAVMRAERSSDALFAYARERGDALRWPDQDTLNVVFAGRWHRLHARWNAQNSMWFWRQWAEDVIGETELREATSAPGIVHFEGPLVVKPWHALCSHPWRDAYRRAWARTPWRDVPIVDDTMAVRMLARLPFDLRHRLYARLRAAR